MATKEINSFAVMFKAYRNINSLTIEESKIVKTRIENDMKLYYTDRSGYWMPFGLRERRLRMLIAIKNKLKEEVSNGTS